MSSIARAKGKIVVTQRDVEIALEEARRLRAEALRDITRAAWRRVAGLFGRHGSAKARHV